MRKKKKAADDAARHEQLRRATINEFNANSDTLRIDADRIPTEDDVLAAKKDFEDAVQEIQSREYLIADAANAVRVAEFLKWFLEGCFWMKEYFKGVINLNAHLDDFLATVEKDGPTDLVMGFAPMQFTFQILDNYAGQGLAAAKAFAERWEEYVATYDSIRDHIEWYNQHNKACENLRNRWAMMAQGFYSDVVEPVDPADFVKPSDYVESDAADVEVAEDAADVE